MLKNKKVIIFDLDGTLIDSVGIWNEIDEILIKKIGTKELDDVDIGNQRDTKLKEYKSFPDAYLEYCGFLKDKYQSEMSKQEIKKLRYEIADRYLKEVVDYKPNVEKFLKFLKDNGFILVIASTTNDSTIEKYKYYNKNIIEKANFEDTFKLVYAKGAVKEIKPNPEIHYKILNELKVKKEECLIIEDALVGVEAANNAGIEVAVIYDRYSDCNRIQINELSNYQFKDFNEILESCKLEVMENK